MHAFVLTLKYCRTLFVVNNLWELVLTNKLKDLALLTSLPDAVPKIEYEKTGMCFPQRYLVSNEFMVNRILP